MKIKRMLVLLLVLVMLVGLLPVLAAAETLEDGYYLIGPDWSVDAIRPADCFTINPANSEEYMLNTTLSEGQRFKVVRVAGGEIAEWFPGGEGNDYLVPASLAGDVRIYFRTVWMNNWGNFYNVVKRYPITASAVHGSVTLSEDSAPKDDTVTITLAADPGYVFSTLEVKQGDSSVAFSGGDGTYTFTMPEGAVTVKAVFAKQIDDGYYLIGPDWSIDDIDTAKVFAANSSSYREYYLTDISLTAGQRFRIVRIESNAIRNWYPQGGEYVVDADHSGERIIYFRRDGMGGRHLLSARA